MIKYYILHIIIYCINKKTTGHNFDHSKLPNVFTIEINKQLKNW